MNFPTEIFGDVVVVHTAEEFGEEQSQHLKDFIPTLLQHKVIVDLDRTENIESGGLTALLDCHDALQGQGGGLKVTTTNGLNRKILEITRLDVQLEVFDSILDAVRSFR